MAATGDGLYCFKLIHTTQLYLHLQHSCHRALRLLLVSNRYNHNFYIDTNALALLPEDDQLFDCSVPLGSPADDQEAPFNTSDEPIW